MKNLTEKSAGKRVVSSPAQRRRGRLLDERGQTGLLRHCLTTTVEITGTVDVALLHAAVDWVVRRHPALRSVFSDGWDHHEVRPALLVPLSRKLITGGDPETRWREAVEFAYADRMRPFDLVRGPLMRATLVSSGPRRHLLVLSFDQMVVDARSAAVVVDELVRSAHLLTTSQPLPEPETDGYPAILARSEAWAESGPGQAAAERRRADLAGTTALLPWARRPDVGGADDLAHHTVSLPDETSAALAARAAENRVVPFAPAFAAFALVVAAEAPAQATLFSVTSMFAARVERDEQSVVGWLSNCVAMVLPRWQGTVRDCVHAAHREILAVLDRQRLPFQDEAAGTGTTVSLLYLPAQLSGGKQTDLRIGDSAARRRAVSFCPTGADVDLFVAEDVWQLSGERPRLAVGGTSARTVIGGDQLTGLVTRWAAALTVLGAVSWDHCSAEEALGRIRRTESFPQPAEEA